MVEKAREREREREKEGRQHAKRERVRRMMKKSVSAIASVAILAATMMIGVNAVCPPPGYDSVEPFSLEAYVADGTPWYVQEQVRK